MFSFCTFYILSGDTADVLISVIETHVSMPIDNNNKGRKRPLPLQGANVILASASTAK